MKIAVDAFGGDNAPLEVIKGAADAVKELGVGIILTGDEATIKKCAADNGIDLSGIEIFQADGVFDMHTAPAEILKSGKNTSLAAALDLVADGKADACVSAGSTGALVVGATFILKRIKGVKRTAIGTVLPGKNKKFMLMDAGANAECRPEMLLQFGIMASAYLKGAEGIENPEIALLNIGTEETKGGELQKEAYKLLSDAPVNFIGNVEARDLPVGVCDAAITDGFTGNVALKLYEGVASTLMKMVKEKFMSNLKTKIAALLAKKSLYSLKKMADYSEIGGAPILGIRKPCIKAHGSSNANAFKNAIKQAVKCAETDVCGIIAEGVAKTVTSSEEE